ncbi:MAG: hypothetical protein RIS26_509 [Actinomycetota bacterium]|jgi:16S rRNA (uracil1498-N3)-methyltransferase
MVLPLFIDSSAATATEGQSLVLGGEEAKHAISVRRIRAGESVQIADGRGHRAIGFVSEVGPKELTIQVTEFKSDPRPTLELTLIQALAKGDRDELAIQAATELGVMAVLPWQAKRSVSRWEGAKLAKGRERWLSIVSEAAKQSLRSWVPEVLTPEDSNGLVKLFSKFDHVLVLEPTANVSLATQTSLRGSVALVVGPEGGIDSSELEIFEAFGAKLVHLGSGVLRTSTAGLAAISYLNATAGLWNSAE